MRKTYFLTLFAAILLLVSCGDKSNKITSKQIVKLYNESAEQMNANKQYVSIDTGYYELASASDRLVLEKLAKEGVINAIPDTLTATFTYYLDKGWTLDNCVIPEIDITNITRPENEAKVDEFNAKEDEEEKHNHHCK